MLMGSSSFVEVVVKVFSVEILRTLCKKLDFFTLLEWCHGKVFASPGFSNLLFLCFHVIVIFRAYYFFFLGLFWCLLLLLLSKTFAITVVMIYLHTFNCKIIKALTIAFECFYLCGSLRDCMFDSAFLSYVLRPSSDCSINTKREKRRLRPRPNRRLYARYKWLWTSGNHCFRDGSTSY